MPRAKERGLEPPGVRGVAPRVSTAGCLVTVPRGQPSAVPAAPVPQSSYRLQLQPGFGFADAAGIASYLASLGVTHAYLSPILQAVPGSVHGYDVVDHSRVSAGLGGEGAFRDMVAQFRRHGLGVIADIVPNHMSIAAPESLNRQFWSVLRDGAGSRFAHWFDIDWPAQGRPAAAADPGRAARRLPR